MRNAVQALVEGNRSLAQRVIDIDQKVDEHEREVDELVTRIVALRQPMAEDLRRIKTALKSASDLERMGDLATNVAKRSLAIENADLVPQREALRRLGERGLQHDQRRHGTPTATGTPNSPSACGGRTNPSTRCTTPCSSRSWPT